MKYLLGAIFLGGLLCAGNYAPGPLVTQEELEQKKERVKAEWREVKKRLP